MRGMLTVAVGTPKHSANKSASRPKSPPKRGSLSPPDALVTKPRVPPPSSNRSQTRAPSCSCICSKCDSRDQHGAACAYCSSSKATRLSQSRAADGVHTASRASTGALTYNRHDYRGEDPSPGRRCPGGATARSERRCRGCPARNEKPAERGAAYRCSIR